jgi:hypothetical protein
MAEAGVISPAAVADAHEEEIPRDLIAMPLPNSLSLPTSVFFGLFSERCCCRQHSARQSVGSSIGKVDAVCWPPQTWSSLPGC